MPVKISLGLNKKLGLPNYSSLGANCQLECELDTAVLQESPARFQAEAERLFGLCREAVEEELARETETNGTPYVAANGHLSGSGNPPQTYRHEELQEISGRPAAESEAEVGLTERQLKFIQDLATQIHGLGIRRLPALVAFQFDKNLTELTSVEASRLIGLLRQVRSGLLRLDTLLEQDAPEA